MRDENLARITNHTIGIKSPVYLVYKYLQQDLKQAIEDHAKGDVFDIGCGNKPYESLFRNKGKYTGCDIVQSSENKVDIICTVDNIPLDANQFDTVISTQVLEHVVDHDKMLAEAYRLLKWGGKIILTAPMVWEHHEVPHDFFRFTRFGLIHIFEKAGFRIIQVKANGGKWALIGQMLQNVIVSSTSSKKNIFRKFLKIVHKYIFKYIINIAFAGLEKIDKDVDFITLNFLVVAEKT